MGPAIAVFWGWLPALLWVVIGSIFIGAVHDFGALIVSLRNQGQTVGEIAGRMISPRTKVLFLLILFFALTIVLAIFGLVIASIFSIYPESVLSVWIEIPIAIGDRDSSFIVAAVVCCGRRSSHWRRCTLRSTLASTTGKIRIPGPNSVIIWTVILLVYCYVASVMPVWLLMQPRDFINSHQLIVALALLLTGLLVASVTGKADLAESAPAIVPASPKDRWTRRRSCRSCSSPLPVVPSVDSIAW